MQVDQSSGPESVEAAIESGRLDDAIQTLETAAATSGDARMLAYLLCQRGDYDRAVDVLRNQRWAETLDTGGLQLRGNSLWRAGRLKDALQDLDAAAKSAIGRQEAAAIRSDIALLQGEIDVMNRVDRSLVKLDITTALTVGLILGTLIEVHRRAVSRALRRP